MGLLAPGGETHVIMLVVMGTSALLVGALIDPGPRGELDRAGLLIGEGEVIGRAAEHERVL